MNDTEKKIKMFYGAKPETFKVTYEETAYCFMECDSDPLNVVFSLVNTLTIMK